MRSVTLLAVVLGTLSLGAAAPKLKAPKFFTSLEAMVKAIPADALPPEDARGDSANFSEVHFNKIKEAFGVFSKGKTRLKVTLRQSWKPEGSDRGYAVQFVPLDRELIVDRGVAWSVIIRAFVPATNKHLASLKMGDEVDVQGEIFVAHVHAGGVRPKINDTEEPSEEQREVMKRAVLLEVQLRAADIRPAAKEKK